MPDTTDTAIETHALTKQFPSQRGWRRWTRSLPFTAVTDINLTIPQGQIFGLLGPNGAGKTTLVKMLCTLIAPSSGHATVMGIPLSQEARIKAQVGLVVADERSFYWRLTAYQNLLFFAAMHELHGTAAKKRADAVLTAVHMKEYAHRRISDFSTGMRQRLAIARALLHQPRLLFLDEPGRSLDPTAVSRLHALIRQLNSQGITIFLVTHNMAEAASLCHTVALMHQGTIRKMGTPAQLRQTLHPKQRYTITTTAVSSELATQLHQINAQTEPGQTEITFSAAKDDGQLTAVLNLLHTHNQPIHTITTHTPTLEEFFTHYTSSNKAEEALAK
ncbi:MAG: daunorubicin resistance protein DrrA family ABC transporter ATP-binding protein [Candidatus Promineifilaceae bacterium]